MDFLKTPPIRRRAGIETRRKRIYEGVSAASDRVYGQVLL